ncbi:MAG: HAMP domain-containing histidine kinase [Solobacterium sp.]|nr:HAMP domain-containing histidine kinase [Solobacterium sp.]
MKKTVSLKWKIGKYLLTFGILVIGMIFLFQIVLLRPMYEKSRIASVKRISDSVVDRIYSAEADDEEDYLEDIIYDSQNETGTCVRVWKRDSQEQMSAVSGNMGCFLYRMRPEERDRYILKAMESEDGAYLTAQSMKSFMDENETAREIIYTRLIEDDEGIGAVMVYASISPVDATVQTLTYQMLIISVLLAIAIVILTMAMNRQIARPLAVINEKAKKLPEGTYEEDEKTNRYTEAQELNQTLAKAAEDIMKADKAKRDLISNVSHDLRTPLTMISGYGEMMIDLPEEKTDENIQVIIDESKRLNTLVNDLLDLSKLQENKIELHPEVFDLTSMIKGQLKKYEVYQYRDGYEIQSDLAPQAMIRADEARVAQVFNNFMTNAINYCGETRKIVVTETVNGDTVRVEVRDYGEGIKEKDLPKIWDRYYKIDKTHVRSTSGSGIGLAIVKEILDLHHAKYGVSSKPHEGSTFWFEFKLAETA